MKCGGDAVGEVCGSAWELREPFLRGGRGTEPDRAV